MRTVMLAGLLALAAMPAAAQNPSSDWDLTVDETQGLMLATVGYSSGQTLAVRCRAGELDVLISGLPAIEGYSRRIETTYPDGRVETGMWFTIGDGALVASPAPRLDARRLRQGGPLQLTAALDPWPGEGQRRYALDLPGSSANLDRVLDACGSGEASPREDLVRWNFPVGRTDMWRRHPVPDYPARATDERAGYAVFSCVVAEQGRLRDCRIERESHDRRVGFGEEALQSLRSAQVAPPEAGGPEPGELVIATIRFQIAP